MGKTFLPESTTSSSIRCSRRLRKRLFDIPSKSPFHSKRKMRRQKLVAKMEKPLRRWSRRRSPGRKRRWRDG